MERTLNNKEERNSTEAVVFFDVDKTIVKDFSITIFAKHLNTEGLLAKSVYDQIQKDMTLPKETPEGYISFANVIVGHFYAGLKDITQEEMFNQGRKFLPTYLTYLMPFSRELVEK